MKKKDIEGSIVANVTKVVVRKRDAGTLYVLRNQDAAQCTKHLLYVSKQAQCEVHRTSIW